MREINLLRTYRLLGLDHAANNNRRSGDGVTAHNRRRRAPGPGEWGPGSPAEVTILFERGIEEMVGEAGFGDSDRGEGAGGARGQGVGSAPTPRVECSACERAVVLWAWEWHVKGQHPETGNVSYRALPAQEPEPEEPSPPGSGAPRIPVASSTGMESVHAQVEEAAERIERLESSMKDSLAALRDEVRRDLDGATEGFLDRVNALEAALREAPEALRAEAQRAWVEAVDDLRTRIRTVELEVGKANGAPQEPPAGPDPREIQRSLSALPVQVEALRARVPDADPRTEATEKAEAGAPETRVVAAGDGLRARLGKAEAQTVERTKAKRWGLFRRSREPPEPEEATGG